jgi:hypothetical protein
MNDKARAALAIGTLMAISDYCESPDEIQGVLDEMNALHAIVMKEQRELLGGQL